MSAFKVMENPELGRYNVAARDLKAGEIFLEEMPFAIGPKVGSSPICLECCCPVDGSEGGPRCSRCGWPLCEECGANSDSIVFHKRECALFVMHKVKFQSVEDSTASCVQLDCITPLRVLLEKDDNPDRWNAEISAMEHHYDARQGTEIWKADQNNVVGCLRGSNGLKDRFAEDLIQQVIGILDVNAFEARTCNGYAVRGLYPMLGITAHSCVPNVVISIHPSEDYRLISRVAVDVSEGENLYTTYTQTLSGTSTRQSALKSGKYFTCNCARCLDPTELGTHFSSLKCQKCDNGLIEPSNPLDEEAYWKCNHCDFTAKGATIQNAVQVMQAELDELTYMEYDHERLENFERVFNKYSSILNPLHFINTSIRHSLIELYGRIPGYYMQELPNILLERKIDLCQDILKVLNVFEPGKSRARATILYELHAPVIMMAQSEFSSGRFKLSTLREKLIEAADMLEECAAILEWEDPSTPEGILANVAKQSLEQLKQSVQSLP